MCGIVGAVAQRNVVPILLEGLQRLEYRGYDSAGLVVVHDAQLERVRSTGRVAELTAKSATTQRPCSASRIRAGRRTACPASATPTRTSAGTTSPWCITASSKTTKSCARA